MACSVMGVMWRRISGCYRAYEVMIRGVGVRPGERGSEATLPRGPGETKFRKVYKF